MTAVEWLVDQMLKQGYFVNNKTLTYTMLDHLQQQAKEMERQQIIDAHGIQTKQNAGVSNYIYQLSGEKYYEQTFKQES
jgi:hypothetical protein